MGTGLFKLQEAGRAGEIVLISFLSSLYENDRHHRRDLLVINRGIL